METCKTKKVKNFLSGLSDLEFRYLRLQVSMANDARNLIKEFKLSKQDFCKLLEISIKSYNKYIRGGFSYDIKKMALMQAAYMKLSLDRDVETRKKEAEENFTDVMK